MAELRYFVIASLDGCIADEAGNFDWAAPDEELHAYVNDRMRDVGTYLYGRRMWETMRYWDTAPVTDQTPAVEADFTAIWQAADKVVYSTTLSAVDTARTRLTARFDPDEVRDLVSRSARDLAVGGPGLAADALRAGMVSELEIVVVPTVAGGGTSWLPAGLRLELELLGERRFASGAVDLRYRVRR